MMTKEVQYPQPLIDYGWSFYDKCMCSGILQYKFRNKKYGGLELVWYPKYYNFRVRNGSMVKIIVTPIKDLEYHLEKIDKEYQRK